MCPRVKHVHLVPQIGLQRGVQFPGQGAAFPTLSKLIGLRMILIASSNFIIVTIQLQTGYFLSAFFVNRKMCFFENIFLC